MKLRLLAFLAVTLGTLPAWAASEAKPCAAEPTNQNITYGDVLSGPDCVISPIADQDFYNFAGVVNQKVRLIATPWRYSPWNQALCWVIYGPDEIPLEGHNPKCSGAALVFEGTLLKTGTYRVRLYENGNDQALSYNLSLTRLLPFPSPAPVLPSNGTVVSDVIDPAADVDTFVIEAAANSTVSLVATPFRYSPWNQALCIELFDSALIAVKDMNGDAVSVCSGNSISREIKFPKTGKYLLVVTESGHDQALSYNLSLNCLFGSCDPKLPICEVSATYSAGSLNVKALLRSVPPSQWNLWMTVQSSMTYIRSIPIHTPTGTPIKLTVPIPLPPSARIGLLSTISRAGVGISCYDFTPVNTGLPAGAASTNPEEGIEDLTEDPPPQSEP